MGVLYHFSYSFPSCFSLFFDTVCPFLIFISSFVHGCECGRSCWFRILVSVVDCFFERVFSVFVMISTWDEFEMNGDEVGAHVVLAIDATNIKIQYIDTLLVALPFIFF